MTISDGIAGYVAYKNDNGVRFKSGRKYLIAFAQHIGNVELNSVKVDRVMAYLNDSKSDCQVWRMKYDVLVRFFEFWEARGEMTHLLLPPPKPKIRREFVPYVYSRAELKALFKAVDGRCDSRVVIDQVTMRTLLLFLYGTGVLLEEAIGLEIRDVDLKNRKITIKSCVLTRCRQIPICDDLCGALHKYLRWRTRKNLQNPILFVTKRDRPLTSWPVQKKFRRIRKIANVVRDGSARFQPCLRDLKCTFAVHRITSWIRTGADLNRMLPALAAYMGQRLGSTERYFQLTPERFTKNLKKLSPRGHRGHWRDDRKLMAFLASV